MYGIDAAETGLPAGLADERPGIWISYVSAVLEFSSSP